MTDNGSVDGTRFLVTGCAGFIGSHLSEELLERGYEVLGVDSFTEYYDRAIKERNLAPALEHERFSFVEDDLVSVDLDDLLERVDGIYHLAAQAGVRSSWGMSFELYLDRNLRATQRLF